jgi:hypothetical protein
MLWRLLVAVLLCQVFASVAMAASVALADVSCVSGTLANYEALESNGCTVHGERVSDFAFSTTSAFGGAVPVTADQVTVNPTSPLRKSSLTFSSTGFSVSAGQSVQYSLAHKIDDPPIIHGWTLLLTDPVMAPAFISITSEECLGAAFLGAVCPTGMTIRNTVFDTGINAVLSDTKLFSPEAIVGVLTTITLDARLGGSASFTSFTESALLEPEPASLVLTTSGLLLLLLTRRGRRKAFLNPGEIRLNCGSFTSRLRDS